MSQASKPFHSEEARRRAFVPGRHSVSPFNFHDEVLAEFEFPEPLALIDSTIRKVIYTAGVRTSVADLLRIGEILEELGVKDESLNLWWWGADQPNAVEWDAVRAFARAGFGFRVNVFTDTLVGSGAAPSTKMRRTVDMLAEAGVGAINPGLIEPPDADAAARQRDEFAAFGEYARQQGLEWTLTIAHCGRRDFLKMVDGMNTAIEAGATRLDPMDSTSTMSPEAMKRYMRTLRSMLVRPVPITMHTHDDFGMATATTVAAVTAGASPDVALNGVSYRSGFAALEEVVLALDVLYGLDAGIRLDRLQWAADSLARIMDMPIHPLKPVIGSHQFLRDSPNDIAKLLSTDRDTFPAFGCSIDPGLVGSKLRWVWGEQSTEEVVRQLALSLGVAVSGAQIKAVRDELDRRRDARQAYPKWVEADEVEEVLLAIAAG